MGTKAFLPNRERCAFCGNPLALLARMQWAATQHPDGTLGEWHKDVLRERVVCTTCHYETAWADQGTYVPKKAA